VSFGVDAHYRDPLTSLVLFSPGYVELMTRSAALATRLCASDSPLPLEGGYHLDALGEVIAGVVARLRGRSDPLALSEVLDDTNRWRSRHRGRRFEPTDRSGTYVDWWCRFRSVTCALSLYDSRVERVQELPSGRPEVQSNSCAM